MKYFLILLILCTSFCLKAKKSPFDVSKPSLGMFGFILSSLNRSTTTSGDTTPPTVTVTNLKSKGTIETGLLIGTASDNVGVASVEVQINSGSYAVATTLTNSTTTTGTKDWTYKIPIAAKWTYAFTNTVNIRITDTSGNITVNAMTSVQKGENRDVNGDGFVDLVIGAPSYNSNNGRVYVFNGSATGISQTSVTSASQTFTGTAGRNFGSSVAMTDINGDGFADMVVCEWKDYTSATNSAYLYYGSQSGFTSQILIRTRTGAPNYLCAVVATGDLNGDGYGDVVISDYDGNGNIYIYSGSSSGLNMSAQTISVASGVSNLGQVTSVGDVNGDGLLDIVSTDSSAGRVVSFHNSSTGFANSITTSITNFNSNSNVMLGDFNNDGKADLAVACLTTCQSSGTNEIQIFYSNGTTLNTTPNARIQREAAGGASAFSPANLGIGDINQDGIMDLLVGDNKGTYPSSLLGRIYVFNGSSTGICNGTCSAGTLASVKITGDTSKFSGKLVRLIDINRDGYPDLITSAVQNGDTTNADGTVYIFNGSASGISATSISDASKTITGTGGSMEQFGSSLY